MNFLFITADQWRGDCLSALQHPCVQTPALDALAAEGVLFARHYCQAVPCGPSRASLHTGLYLMNHRSVINGTPLDRRHANWAQLLRSDGYDPVLFGYTDTSVDPRDYPPDHPALTTFEGLLPGLKPEVLLNEGDLVSWAEWLRSQGHPIPERLYDLFLTRTNQPEWEAGGPAPAPLALDAAHHDTRFLTDRAIDYITRASGSAGPGWCVHLSLLRPHPPWVAPAPYNAMYPPEALPGFLRAPTPAEESAHPWLSYQMQQRGARVPADARTLRRLKASYFGLMSEVDDNLGRLMSALASLGEREKTFIIFTSDHGEQMGDHWLMGKCGYFDQSYHVPLIIRDPTAAADGTRGTRVNAFTEHVDIMPTLLHRAGIEAPAACDGRSLLPWLQSVQGATGWRDAAHWEFDFRDPADPAIEQALGLPMGACNLAVIRDDNYKYVHFAGLPSLLFDLQADPNESIDRSREPDMLSVVIAYAEKMLAWRAQHADKTLSHVKLTDEGPIRRTADGQIERGL